MKKTFLLWLFLAIVLINCETENVITENDVVADGAILYTGEGKEDVAVLKKKIYYAYLDKQAFELEFYGDKAILKLVKSSVFNFSKISDKGRGQQVCLGCNETCYETCVEYERQRGHDQINNPNPIIPDPVYMYIREALAYMVDQRGKLVTIYELKGKIPPVVEALDGEELKFSEKK
jgi:hypothetical protein